MTWGLTPGEDKASFVEKSRQRVFGLHSVRKRNFEVYMAEPKI